MKSKPDSVRTYDPDGFRRRAAAVCVRSEALDEVLLVSSSREPSKWVVPGGGVEPDELCDRAAIREVWEEAGVVGTLGRRIGVFENPSRHHRTTVFLLTVTEECQVWEDSTRIGRRRRWFLMEDAVKELTANKPLQSHYLRSLLDNEHTLSN